MSEAVAVLSAVVALAAVGCGADEPVSGFDSQAAEDAFVACASGFGVEITSVRIDAPGDLSVRVSDDAPDEGVAKVQQECEPAAFAAGGGDRDGGNARAEPELPIVPDDVEDVDDYLEVLERQAFSGALLVQDDGAVSTAAAVGETATGAAAGITTETAFDVGSIAKLFTAVAVLELVDAGELSLDDPLAELLEGVPEDKGEITVRQLLDFTSGLREYHDTEGDFEDMSQEEARQAILGQELLFEPGTDTAYSNSSYTLAAMAVSEVTGRDFTDVVADVFDAADLAHTGFYGSPALRDVSVARGMEGKAHARNDPAEWRTTWALLGSGGIVSSVEDLARFWNLLGSERLLGPEATAILFEEFVPSRSVGGVEFRGLSGANDFGFEASIVDVPAEDVLVVVATNANPADRMLATEASLVLVQLALSHDG